MAETESWEIFFHAWATNCINQVTNQLAITTAATVTALKSLAK